MAKSISVGELKEILERIQEIYALAGANGPAADFKRLIGTLTGHEGSTVEQFVEETRILLSFPPASSPRRMRRLTTKLSKNMFGDFSTPA